MPRPPAPPDTPTIDVGTIDSGTIDVGTIEVRTPAKAPDLTINKVIAGAGAAATAAVLGSYLGAAGTVAGAALGSVALTVATTLYQRSLDRTRDRVVARIRPGTIPAQRRSAAADADTVVFEPVPPPRRPWRRAVVATVVVFVLGLAAVTGLEWVKGSTLTTNQTGTSVGRVITPSTDTGPSTEESPEKAAESTGGSTDGGSETTGTDATGTDSEESTPPMEDTGPSATPEPEDLPPSLTQPSPDPPAQPPDALQWGGSTPIRSQ